MATIHMETSEATSCSSRMKQAHEQIASELNTTRSQINGLVGSGWIAQSANEFHNEFDSLAHQLETCLASLETLHTRLDREIAEWEQMQNALA